MGFSEKEFEWFTKLGGIETILNRLLATLRKIAGNTLTKMVGGQCGWHFEHTTHFFYYTDVTKAYKHCYSKGFILNGTMSR